jgi:hypothetical protein
LPANWAHLSCRVLITSKLAAIAVRDRQGLAKAGYSFLNSGFLVEHFVFFFVSLTAAGSE